VQRPDPLELVTSFKLAAEGLTPSMPGSTEEERINAAILAFNKATTVRNCRIDGDERLAVKLICSLPSDAVAILEKVWSTYKHKESPITGSLLASPILRKKNEIENNLVWSAFFNHADRVSWFFKRLIGGFEARLKRATLESGKVPTLRGKAHNCRDKNMEDVFMLSSCFAAWVPLMTAQLSPAGMAEATDAFCRSYGPSFGATGWATTFFGLAGPRLQD
jgi:hypothetical protein